MKCIAKLLAGLSLLCVLNTAYAIVAFCNKLESYILNLTDDTLFTVYNTPDASQQITIPPHGFQKLGDGGINLALASMNSATTIYLSAKYENDSKIFYSILEKWLNEGPVVEKDFALTATNYQVLHVVLNNGNCKKLIPGQFIYAVTRA